ncbi:MAG: RidA family protein [Stomatobaculum sp.]|nr:RidA family protein [Stomatobaculum sp.]
MSANPIPQGKYVPAVRYGNIIFTAGMTPRDNGVLIMTGKVLRAEEPAKYAAAVRQAAKNALTAAKNTLKEGERIERLLSFTVFVNAEEGYTAHAKFADAASEYFCEELGEGGSAARASVGVASLPGDAPCEIQIIAAASPAQIL